MTKLETVITNKRLLHALRIQGFTYLDELANITSVEINSIKGIGKKSVQELMDTIKSFDFSKSKNVVILTDEEKEYLLTAVNKMPASNNELKASCIKKLSK